jgi:pilus assembly protein CpaE
MSSKPSLELPVILVTVSSDRSLHAVAREALEGHFRFQTWWDLDYHDEARLRAIGSEEKCIVLIDFGDADRAFKIAGCVDGRPQMAVIAIGGGATREGLLQLMQAGIREVLPELACQEIVQAVRRSAAKLTSADELFGQVHAFVPAKPGCGATTIATYATAAVARLTAEPTLLLDFDIRLGVTSFLLKAEGTHTIVDALQASDRLDDDLWSGLVSQRGKLHVLGSGPVDFSRPVPAERFSELLDFAVRKYSLIGVDLPGSMEHHECETLLRSKRVFLVCASDIGALHVARRKSVWLRDLGLADKVSVILSCVERKNALLVRDIERIIQMPVRYVVPHASGEIARAAQKGAAIEGSSSFAKQIELIALEIGDGASLFKKPNAVRRFVEYFSISAARDVGKS